MAMFFFLADTVTVESASKRFRGNRGCSLRADCRQNQLGDKQSVPRVLLSTFPVTGTASDPYIQVRANAFPVPAPPIPSPAPQGYNANETAKSSGTNISLVEGKPYDGLFFGVIEDAFGGGNDWKKVDRVGPVFMTDASGNLPTFEMQVLLPDNGSLINDGRVPNILGSNRIL